MIAFKNTSLFILFICTISSLSSCWRDILDSKCGESRLLGTLQFADSTKSLYANWTGNEVLFFKDSLGNEQEYFSEKGKTILFKQPLIINTLCDSGWLDKQTEYFDTEAHFLDFVARNNNKSSLHIQLSASIIDKKSTFIIFDLFLANFSIGATNSAIELAVARDNSSAINLQNQFITNSKFVADTTILGKNFKNVFYNVNNFNNSAIYFQKTKMIIGFKEAGKTWLLDRIK